MAMHGNVDLAQIDISVLWTPGRDVTVPWNMV